MTRSPMRLLASVALAIDLAACARTSPTDFFPVSRLALSTRDVAKGAQAPHRKLRTTLRIEIPKHRYRKRVLIHGHYVSAATQSIAIAITPAGGGSTQHFNTDLTPASNPNCTASLVSSLVCTISISLAPGSYTGTFATYDGLLDGNGNPTGNELSADQNVPFTFVAGRSNALSVTLDGIPSSVALLPLGSALSGNTTSGYAISKCFSSARVEVLGLDADSNPIVGPGAPTPALSSDDTTHLAVASPAPSSPNSFALSRPNIPNANSVVHLTAIVTPLTGSGGNAQSAQVNVTFNGDICGVITEYSVPTSFGDPYGITSGPDGALWFAECNANKIGRITTGGTISEYSIPTSASKPNGITAGPDGALWFAEFSGNKIGRITTGGAITEFSVPTSGAGPSGITAGPDGDVWFTEYGANKIGRIDTGGSFAEYSVPTTNAEPYSIAAGHDEALWFTEAHGDKIGRIATGGTISEYSGLASNAGPFGIVTGPDDALWFTEFDANKIGRITTGDSIAEYSVPTSNAQPTGMVTGPDEALWFVESDANKIGRITTGGTITEYSGPASGGYLFGITTGPDGALWFVEAGGYNKIGRLQ